WDGTSRLWEPWSGRELVRLETAGFRFTADGRRLGFLKGDALGVYELNDAGGLRALSPRRPWKPTSLGPPPETGDVDFGPDGRLVATTSNDGLRLWDAATGREAAHLAIGLVESARFDPRGRWLWTFGEYGLHRWPIESGREPAGLVRLGPPEP